MYACVCVCVCVWCVWGGAVEMEPLKELISLAVRARAALFITLSCYSMSIAVETRKANVGNVCDAESLAGHPLGLGWPPLTWSQAKIAHGMCVLLSQPWCREDLVSLTHEFSGNITKILSQRWKSSFFLFEWPNLFYVLNSLGHFQCLNTVLQEVEWVWAERQRV